MSHNTVDETEFAKDVAEMVADHAPRLFAIVLEYRDQVDARIVAWGIELDDGAYMTTVDGRRQYSLADAHGALKYVRGNPDTTPRLVWAGPERE